MSWQDGVGAIHLQRQYGKVHVKKGMKAWVGSALFAVNEGAADTNNNIESVHFFSAETWKKSLCWCTNNKPSNSVVQENMALRYFHCVALQFDVPNSRLSLLDCNLHPNFAALSHFHALHYCISTSLSLSICQGKIRG